MSLTRWHGKTSGDSSEPPATSAKVMAYKKEKDEKVKLYATEILNDNGKNNLIWQLEEPTGWKKHMRPYRELQKPVQDTYEIRHDIK